MHALLPAAALAAALVVNSAAAQKPGSSGNLPPLRPEFGQGPGPGAPRMALPRDKPPPLGVLPGPAGLRPPRPGAGSSLAALPREKPPALPRTATGPGAPGGPRQNPAQRQVVSTGTGFVVAPRAIMTNHHVVAGCASVTARLPGGREIEATVIASDPRRDLALLRTDSDPGPSLSFRGSAEVRRGENVVTYGFPLAGLLSSGPTLTTGDVSALSGLRDNPRQIQISAPVQQGNSGGPLLDLHGHVVGVIVSKLDAQRIAEVTGDIPQNVNFAVKHTEAIDFMRENGIQPQLAQGGPQLSAAEVGELAHASTLFLRCLR